MPAINRLFRRSATSSPVRAKQKQLRLERMMGSAVEKLEERTLLSTVYVNNDWGSYGFGQAFDPDGAGAAFPIVTFGVDAFDNIQDGIDAYDPSFNTELLVVAGDAAGLGGVSGESYPGNYSIYHDLTLKGVYNDGDSLEPVGGTGIQTTRLTLTGGGQLGAGSGGVFASDIRINRSGSTPSKGTRIGDAVSLANAGGTIRITGPTGAQGQYVNEASDVAVIDRNLTLIAANTSTIEAVRLTNGAQIASLTGLLSTPTVSIDRIGSLAGPGGTRLSDAQLLLSPGGQINAAAGTWVENLNVTKRLTLDGDGAGSTILQANNASQPALTFSSTATGTGVSQRLIVSDLSVTGSTGSDNVVATGISHLTLSGLSITNAGDDNFQINYPTLNVTDIDLVNLQISGATNNGILLNDSTNTLTDLLIQGGTIQYNRGSGFITGYTESAGVDDITIDGTAFTGNGWQNGQNFGNVMFNLFNGDATITDVTIDGTSNQPGVNDLSTYGINFTGATPWAAAGTVVLTDIDINGRFRKSGLQIQRYSQIDGFNTTPMSVDLINATVRDFTSTVVADHSDSDPLDLGTSKLNKVNLWQNGATPGGADATDATFYIYNTTTPLDKDVLADNFTIADQVVDAVDVTPWVASNTLRWKTGEVFITPNSFFSPMPGANVQNAVKVALPGDAIYVQAGTYSGDVTISSNLTLRTAGDVNLGGFLNASAGTISPGIAAGSPYSPTLADQIDTITATTVSLTGPAALVVQVASSTSYDRLVATGSVTLSDATLTVLDEGYLPDLDNPTLTLISSAGAVTGTFDGLAEGDTVTIGDFNFAISYVAGVTLTLEDPDIVYVDDDWTGSSVGDTVGANYIFGYNAWATIQDGVDAVAASGSVNVADGTYDEAVLVNKTVTLSGAGLPTVTRTAGSNQNLITVAAPNVTIDGFELVVNRPFATSGIYATNAGGFDDLTISDNTIRSEGTGGSVIGVPISTSSAGVVLIGDGSPFYEWATISGNTIEAGADPDAGGPLVASLFARGIWLREMGADVTSNSILASTQDLLFQFATGGDVDIDDNTFYGAGADFTEPFQNGSTNIDITNNDFLPVSPLFSQSLLIKHSAGVPIVISANTFTGHTTGLYIGGSDGVTATDNSFTPAAGLSAFRNIYVNTGWPGTIAGTFVPVEATIQGNTLNGNTGSTGSSLEFATTIVGAGYGSITVGGAGALANTFNDTAAGSRFIRLSNLTNPTTLDVDATENLFALPGGTSRAADLNPAVMVDLADLFALEDRIVHEVDLATLGFVTTSAGRVFVTPNSFDSPSTTTPSIQRGINAASAGNTVYVQDGTYAGNLTVNKALTIIGGGSTASDTVVSASPGIGIDITASGVTIEDLRVTGATHGIQVGSVSTTTLDGIAAVGNTTSGVNVVGSTGSPTEALLIQGSELSGNAVGFRMGTAAALDDLDILGGVISANVQGIFVAASTSGGYLTDVLIDGTAFTGNTQKGAYIEKLSDATITNVAFTNNGTDTAYNFNAGLDLNLKYGNYSNITLSNATFTGNGTGADAASDVGNSVTIKARNDAPSYNTNPATLTSLTLSNVDISAASGPGSVILLALGNDVDLDGVSLSDVDLAGAGSVGLLVYGSDPGEGLALSDTAFDAGLAGYIINSATGTTIDGTTATYGGVSGGNTLNDADAFAISDKIADSVDVAAYGKVVLRDGYVYVTPASFFAPITTTPSIQRGINTADSGDTVRVQSGTYSESPTVNKSLSLIGDGSATTTIDLLQPGTLGATYLGAFTISGAGNTVLVRGFTIEGKDAVGLGLATTNVLIGTGLGSVTLDQNRFEVGAVGSESNGDDGFGVLTTYSSPGTPVGSLSVTDSEFAPVGSQGQRAFYINPSVTNFEFTGNAITGKFAGRALTQADNSVISFNTITGTGVGSGSRGLGVYREPGSSQAASTLFERNTFTGLDEALGVFDADGVVIQNNKFDTVATGVTFLDFGGASDAGTTQVVGNSFTNIATSAISNSDTGVADAEGNWFGSLRGPTIGTNPGGDGALVGANVDYTPWIGVFTNSTPGGEPGFVPTGTTIYAVPTKLVFSQQPSSTASQGVPFSQQPVVTAVDADGVLGVNFDFDAISSQVTLTLNPGIYSGVLTGTATVNAANGVATFAGLAIDSAGVYTLTAADSGFALNLTDVTSDNITIDFPTPTLGSILPDRIAVNHPGFTMTLTGTGFYPSSVAYWDADGPGGAAAQALTTTYVSATQLTASVPGSLLTTIDTTIDVTVFNIPPGGGLSNVLNFQVLAAPSVVQVDDNYAGSSLGQNLGAGYYFGYNAFPTIQEGINAVAASGTVNVLAGTYVEDVGVNKTINLVGAGIDQAIISGAIGGDGATVRIGASGVVVEGFTITRQGNNTTDWNNPGLNSAGVAVQGLSPTGITVRNNKLTGNRTGIDLNNVTGITVTRNTIDGNRTGIIMRNEVSNTSITENFVTNNWTVGVLWLEANPGTSVDIGTGTVVTNNHIAGNWYAQIENRAVNPNTDVKNFSGNWLGTTTPTFSNATGGEPGYAAQIPVIYGGTATPPGSPQPTAKSIITGLIDYTPWLFSGTDIDLVTPGFQGDFSQLVVGTDAGQFGGGPRIQEAIGLATGATPTVHVSAATYNETVAANKAGLKIIGFGGTPTISPLGGSDNAIAVSANGVTLEALALSLNSTGSAVVNTAAISSLTVKDVSATNGTGAGITITDQYGSVSGVTLQNLNVSSNQGGGIRLLADNGNSISGVAVSGSTFGTNRFYAIQIKGNVVSPMVGTSTFTWGSVTSSPNTHGVVITGTNIAGTNSPTGVNLSNNTFNGYNNVTPAYAIILTDPANSFKSVNNATATGLTMDGFTFDTNPIYISNRVFDKADDPALGLVTLATPAISQIIDNSSPGGFSTTGTWLPSGLGGFSGNSLYANSGALATATWTFPTVPGKTYRVMVTYPSNAASATSALFIIRDGATPVAGARLNQSIAPDDTTVDGATWEYLGAITSTASSLSVVLSNESNSLVRADAVRIVEIVTPPPAASIVDNSDAGFSTVGSWPVSTLPGAYNGTSLYSTSASATATWSFNVTPGKTYTVMGTWLAHPTNATNVTYDVRDGLISKANRSVNQQVAPSGVFASGFNWSIFGTVTITGSQLNVVLTSVGGGSVVRADAIRIVQVDPLSVDESIALPIGLDVASIDTATLRFHAKAAIKAWARAGLDRATLNLMRRVQFVVTDLPGRMVGVGAPGLVQIDPTAGGFGWSLLATSRLGSRFGVTTATAALGIDLLSVIAHELGHTVGLEDLDPATNPGSLMAATITPGVRRLPTAADVAMIPGHTAAADPVGEAVDELYNKALFGSLARQLRLREQARSLGLAFQVGSASARSLPNSSAAVGFFSKNRRAGR